MKQILMIKYMQFTKKPEKSWSSGLCFRICTNPVLLHLFIAAWKVEEKGLWNNFEIGEGGHISDLILGNTRHFL